MSVEVELRSAGLEVLGPAGEDTSPTVLEAISAVANIEVVPNARIPRKAENVRAEIHRMWVVWAHRIRMIAADGSFRVAGSMELGWFRVHLTPRTDISRMVCEYGGSECVARAAGGRQVCAAKGEEYDFWIVVKTVDRR
ncbi:hypothetical protein H8N00_08455 [Streptomyces sp. AC563]|uniref:hypothetical protein n=1 Tax=Streptomyces buecherae TaxID=2763006 RepID=UPI00164E105E|nr:hypothetical protein [Streptomyces buecherae]MBC3988912.1 hypothetical protein [Streptomyces buecherae]